MQTCTEQALGILQRCSACFACVQDRTSEHTTAAQIMLGDELEPLRQLITDGVRIIVRHDKRTFTIVDTSDDDGEKKALPISAFFNQEEAGDLFFRWENTDTDTLMLPSLPKPVPYVDVYVVGVPDRGVRLTIDFETRMSVLALDEPLAVAALA